MGIGVPSGSPVMDKAPPAACATGSNTLKPAFGPLKPNPLIRAIISLGLIDCICFVSIPNDSSTSGP